MVNRKLSRKYNINVDRKLSRKYNNNRKHTKFLKKNYKNQQIGGMFRKKKTYLNNDDLSVLLKYINIPYNEVDIETLKNKQFKIMINNGETQNLKNLIIVSKDAVTRQVIEIKISVGNLDFKSLDTLHLSDILNLSMFDFIEKQVAEYTAKKQGPLINEMTDKIKNMEDLKNFKCINKLKINDTTKISDINLSLSNKKFKMTSDKPHFFIIEEGDKYIFYSHKSDDCNGGCIKNYIGSLDKNIKETKTMSAIVTQLISKNYLQGDRFICLNNLRTDDNLTTDTDNLTTDTDIPSPNMKNKIIELFSGENGTFTKTDVYKGLDYNLPYKLQIPKFCLCVCLTIEKFYELSFRNVMFP